MAVRVVTFDQNLPRATYDQGCRLAAAGRWEEALASFDESERLGLDVAELHYGRGIVLQQLGRQLDAVESYDQALARDPCLVFALNNRGAALLESGRPEEAIESVEGALRLDGNYVRAWSNHSRALSDLGRPGEALVSADRALALKPNDPGALNNRGTALWSLGRAAAALESYDRALEVNPAFALALSNRCNLLQNTQRHFEAANGFERLLRLAPQWKFARANLLSSRLHCCDWAGYEEEVSALVEAVSSGACVADPFQLLPVLVSARAQFQCAQAFAEEKVPVAHSHCFDDVRRRGGRIRLAYMSSDFRMHAVSFLLAGLFELHDRDRFEVVAISLRSEDKSAMGQRLKAAFDRTLDVSAVPDRDAATLIRSLDIDILVDLNGYTSGARTGILSYRPAPIQVNYLGYPGTMGSPNVDYIIADDFVVPEGFQDGYSEKVVRLPDCFQVNDSSRRRSPRTPERSDEGIPGAGLVFCSFNNVCKIAPQVFDIWMRLLHAVPGSVLWFITENEHARLNLSREARARGVDPARLVFGRMLPYAQHLARIHLADLFLDTFPFNAGTTASDALWAGVPVLTCAGEAFASRMAGSLLRSLGIPELITTSLQEYESVAMALSTSSSTLEAIRARLEANRSTHALFDTERFRRNVEAAYCAMWARFRSGEEPAGFSVDCVPS